MKTHIYYLTGSLSMASTLASCSKEGDCNPNHEESPCYRAVVVGARLLWTEYKINGKRTSRYKYDGENRMTTFYVHDQNGVNKSMLTYNYNERGRLAISRKAVNGKSIITGNTPNNADYPTKAEVSVRQRTH